jgi:hypothetical protein
LRVVVEKHVTSEVASVNRSPACSSRGKLAVGSRAPQQSTTRPASFHSPPLLSHTPSDTTWASPITILAQRQKTSIVFNGPMYSFVYRLQAFDATYVTCGQRLLITTRSARTAQFPHNNPQLYKASTSLCSEGPTSAGLLSILKVTQ